MIPLDGIDRARRGINHDGYALALYRGHPCVVLRPSIFGFEGHDRIFDIGFDS